MNLISGFDFLLFCFYLCDGRCSREIILFVEYDTHFRFQKFTFFFLFMWRQVLERDLNDFRFQVLFLVVDTLQIHTRI